MKRRIIAAVVVATVAAGAGTAIAASGSGGTSSDYNPVASTRLADTRGTSAVGIDKTLVVAAPASVPANATALTVNITVTAPTATSGYILAYADGTTRPAQGSTINFTKGETIATQATVPVSDGKIDLYNASGGTVQLIVDLEGYFTPTAAPYTPPTATTWTPSAIPNSGVINTGGSAASRATLVGTYTLEPGTYQLTVDAKETPIVQSSSSTQVFPQLFVYDQPLSSSFAGNVLNVGSGALESGSFNNIDSYYSGTGSITIAGTAPVTIYTYAFGYDSDTGSGSYTLDYLTETAVPQAG